MKSVNKKITFALFFGNRGFFPGEVIFDARKELQKAVFDAGFESICMDESKTRYGAVETFEEGRAYAEFLKDNKEKIDGIILCMPNFSDECGALIALKDANVPILVQAYPDEIGKMDFAHRRDAMCGKFAMCNVLRQADIPYTLTKKFVIAPTDPEFQDEIKRFAAICRVVKGMKSFSIGAIGARTTAFKTVRVDEIALQKKGISLETIDLSSVFSRIEKVSKERTEEKKQQILSIAEYSGFPAEKLEKMAKLQAVIEDIVKEYNLQAIAIRCWNEFQTILGIVPCTTVALMNDLGICAACEVDVTNAVMMYAMSLAMDAPCMLLDCNNNYGEQEDKAIMFHCGPVAPSLLESKGKIGEHLMYSKTYGEGCGVGLNMGKIKSGDITFASLKTENGKLYSFVTQATFTDDEIENEFFGCGKVVQKANINDIANYMAENGYKHHCCVVFGNCQDIIAEAFNKYLGYEAQEL